MPSQMLLHSLAAYERKLFGNTLTELAFWLHTSEDLESWLLRFYLVWSGNTMACVAQGLMKTIIE